jgi:hypothetical protein
MFLLNQLFQRAKLEAAWADTQLEEQDATVLDDLRRLEDCLLSSERGTVSTGNAA